MATRFDITLQMTNSTDALWRAWIQFIHDTFITTGGWVDPGDTGQMVIATSSHPTLANTFVGFRMYRMADALQATSPVFVRVDFYSGAAANTPQIVINFGTGTNGTGTLTGAFGNQMVVTCFSNNTNATHSYSSASTNRIALLMFVAAANTLMIMSIERTKDATGADTGAGLLCTWGNGLASVGALQISAYQVPGGSSPPVEVGLNVVLSNQSGSSVFGGDVGVGVPLHFKSTAVQPGLGTVVVNSADFIAEATPTFTFYGATHVYQLGNPATSQVGVAAGNGTVTYRATTRVGIRFE